MSFIRWIARLLTAIVLMSGFAKAMTGQQEKPVEPESLTGAGEKFGLVINGFAAGNFNYNFNTDENSFESSVLAVSLFSALSDRVSFFGQVTVSKEEASPFAQSAAGTTRAGATSRPTSTTSRSRGWPPRRTAFLSPSGSSTRRSRSSGTTRR